MLQRLRQRVASARRDVSTVLNDLRGRHPPPLVARSPGARHRTAGSVTAAAARPLVVRAIHHDTADATAIVLADPTGAPISFVAGQFLTVLIDVDGEVLRRAYSICSSIDTPGQVTVCAKRVPGGRVSTYLHDRLAVGDVVPVLGPSGEFTLTPDPAARRRLVLIAGGSGITPCLAIIRAVVAHEPGSTVTLIYGNRGAADVIFGAELDALCDGDRLVVRYLFDEPDGRRLDRATVAAELDAIAARIDDATHYYVCGPAAALDAAVDELAARGVAPARIHVERFATPERARRASAAQRLTVRRAGAVVDAVVAADATILDAALAAGVVMPFSCAMGGCGACAIDLVAGDVELDEPNCLSPAERARGRILSCVARPCGPCTVEVP
jgi:ring-1,2-phenylacetyl-CoA epoxidase subunit PaaE